MSSVWTESGAEKYVAIMVQRTWFRMRLCKQLRQDDNNQCEVSRRTDRVPKSMVFVVKPIINIRARGFRRQ